MISIIFPHAINKENNKVFELNLKMLKENTTCDYEVLSLWNNRPDLVYEFWDWGIRHAKYDFILWHNTDIVMGPGWNENVIKSKDKGDWIGIELVECGQIGVHPNNIHKDFGITADTFRRKEFEDWVFNRKWGKPTYREGFCWYSPSVWRKDWYIKMGGFHWEKPFPHPNDTEFKEICELSGCRFIVANEYAYHFQRAGENLGEKNERICIH